MQTSHLLINFNDMKNVCVITVTLKTRRMLLFVMSSVVAILYLLFRTETGAAGLIIKKKSITNSFGSKNTEKVPDFSKFSIVFRL